MRNLHRNEYDTIDEMWSACVEDLINHGRVVDSRDGGTRETIGYAATLTDPSRCLLRSPARGLDPYYAAAECMWYLSGTDDTRWLEQFAPQYARFVDAHVAYGAYGKRLFEREPGCSRSLVEWAYHMLKEKPDSRQAVIDLHEPRDLRNAAWRHQKDIPCTTSVQLLLRDGRLDMIVTMRSNDVWLGMPYDIFWWCTLLKILSCELECAMGEYHHRAGSMHLYERNREAAQQTGEPAITCHSWERVSDTLACARSHAMWLVHDQLKAHDGGRIGYQLHEVCLAKLENRPVDRTKVPDYALDEALHRRSE